MKTIFHHNFIKFIIPIYLISIHFQIELSIKMDKDSSKRNIDKIDLKEPQAKRVKLSATEIHEACMNNDSQKVITIYRNSEILMLLKLTK